MLRALDGKDYNWPKIFEENEKNPRAVYNHIMKEDDGRKRRSTLETPYRPPKQKPPKMVPAVAAGSTSGVEVKKPSKVSNFGNKKKKVPPPRRPSAAAAALTASSGTTGIAIPARSSFEDAFGPASSEIASSTGVSMNLPSQEWAAATTSVARTNTNTVAPSTVPVDVDVDAPTLQRLISNDSLLGTEEFNLGFFDDDNSNSIHVYNAEAWQNAAAKAEAENMSSSDEVKGANVNVPEDAWKSAIAEQESSQARERLVREQREQQQEQLRRLREEGLQNAFGKLEKERQEQEEAVRREQERVEEQKRLAEERERERKAREEKTQTVDLDSQRVDMYANYTSYIANY
jgi:hypothetical protein